MLRSLLSIGLLVLLTAPSARAQLWHEPFDNTSDWKVVTADGVDLKATTEQGQTGSGIRLDYDFTRGSGYGIIRHNFTTPIVLPENYRFAFHIRGSGPRNTLEFKLIDETGDNVWWVNQRNFEFPAHWTAKPLLKRHFSFAWGPSGGKPLAKLGAIEIAITSFNGGKGTVWLDELALEPLPAVTPYTGTPKVTVTSRDDGSTEPLAVNADNFLGWRSAGPDKDKSPAAVIDFEQAREFGGLVLEWADGHALSNYTVSTSLDNATWTRAATVSDGNGGRDYLPTPDAVGRYIKIEATADTPPPLDGLQLKSIRIMPPEFGDSQNEMMKVIAADAPRGWYPKQFLSEKSYWTVVGVPGDTKEALINEEGSVEIDKSSLTLEPFITIGDRLITWAETENTQALADSHLPIPTVTRRLNVAGSPTIDLIITAFAFGKPGESWLAIKYELKNTSDVPHSGTLSIAARPFQVNPPEQFLNTPGGVATVRSIRVEDAGVSADRKMIVSIPRPTAFGATRSDQGEIVEHLAARTVPKSTSATDPTGLASAAFGYPFSVKPGESQVVWFLVPFHRMTPLFSGPSNDSQIAAQLDQLRTDAVSAWRDRLNHALIRLPASHQHLWDSVRSNLAYILINADGPGIQPGSRSYERTWIRDGSLTSAALLAFGFESEVKQFVDWYATYQYDTGKIPCVVDTRGPDPVPENDSHGEYIFAVAECYRYTHDKEFLQRHWPHVLKAVEYIELLRNQRMTPEFKDGPDDKRVFFGLMPESISHEGYSAKPMHSYWDDLFTLKGLGDAAFIAQQLGDDAHTSRLGTLRDSFSTTLLDSIALAMKLKHIDYLPGCAELGDFDATSTTVALWPCGQQAALPRAALDATFNKYMTYFRERATGTGEGGKSEAYTPYEWRTVGSLIRLDRRDDAAEVLKFLMNDQRPRGWNHWAEVVWKDPKTPKFIGDMPHTWVGSDFINSVRAMLAYERDDDHTIVLAAGLPLDLFRSREGIDIKGLKTSLGPVEYSIASTDTTTTITIPALTIGPPLRGYTVRPPVPSIIKALRLNGQPAKLNDSDELFINQLPAKVELDYR